MNNEGNNLKLISELLILTGVCMLGLFFFSAVGLMLAMPITGLKTEALVALNQAPDTVPNGRLALLIMQAVTATGAFFIAPSVYLQAKKRSVQWLMYGAGAHELKKLQIVLAIGIFMMPALAYLVEWNEQINLSYLSSTFEQWARAKEDELKQLTKFLTAFESWHEFVVGFLVISILAGFTEEYFFRGILQPRLIALLGNHHAGIWAAGLIFSIIHLQFYGLVPRWLLGVLFGYYYYWSRNLWLSIFGHSLNNGMSLVAMYLNQRGSIDIDLESTAQIPWYTAVFSLVAVAVLVHQFYKVNRT